MKNLVKISSLLMVALALQSFSAQGSQKKAVQDAMRDYVETHSSEGKLPLVYRGKILRLTLAPSKKYPDAFHHGVQNKGDLFASCADFTDQAGNRYDVDFLVNKVGSEYKVIQPIVHSVNGKKNPYDLDH